MSYSDKHKLFFVHIPKNGGTTIEKNLGLKSPGHQTWEFLSKRNIRKWEDYHKFAVVRDPIERFISNYKYSRMETSHYHSVSGNSMYGKHPDYDICSQRSADGIVDLLTSSSHSLKHPGWKLQAPFIFDNSDQLMVDEVLLMSDINGFISRYIPTTPSLKNASPTLPILLTELSKEKLRKYYQRDYFLLSKYLEKK